MPDDLHPAVGWVTIRRACSARPVIGCRFVWKLGDDMTPDWPVTRGYVVEIEGDPDVRVTIESPEGHFDGAVTTGLPCVNAIPAVCAPPPCARPRRAYSTRVSCPWSAARSAWPGRRLALRSSD
jgi:hypothetical protein